jgi:hypothetical protein
MLYAACVRVLGSARVIADALAFSLAGVLGPAITEAEHAQEAGIVDRITCTGAVRLAFGFSDHHLHFNDLARAKTEALVPEFFDVTTVCPT